MFLLNRFWTEASLNALQSRFQITSRISKSNQAQLSAVPKMGGLDNNEHRNLALLKIFMQILTEYHSGLLDQLRYRTYKLCF